MVERRLHERQPAETQVRLYHCVFGTLDGTIGDLSEGGMMILLDEVPKVHPGNGDGRFQLRPNHMDVLFDMQCIRITEDGLVLAFIDKEDESLFSGQ